MLAQAADAERAGNPGEAGATYRKVLQLDPDTNTAREALVRLLVEREREIRAFVPEEYWTITALLKNSAQSKLWTPP